MRNGHRDTLIYDWQTFYITQSVGNIRGSIDWPGLVGHSLLPSVRLESNKQHLLFVHPRTQVNPECKWIVRYSTGPVSHRIN